jgi:N-acylneuraminate cytidylyltransferase
MKKILCIIPARSGSKGIINKNIKLFKGKPLIVWSINQAKESKYYKNNSMRIILSTDNELYANIGLECNIEVPFLRPLDISCDNSSDFEFMDYTLKRLKKNENYECDIILHLRPTQPLRKIYDIDKCLDIFIEKYDNYDSLRSVIENEKSPYKMYLIKEENKLDNNSDYNSELYLEPLFKSVNKIEEPYNSSRQLLPKTYLHNGYIDIVKSTIIINKKSISGTRIIPYIMDKDDIIDIDTENDWNKAETLFSFS